MSFYWGSFILLYVHFFFCLSLDLDDEATFRDLSRPIGALNPERLARLKVHNFNLSCFVTVFNFMFVCFSDCWFFCVSVYACLPLCWLHDIWNLCLKFLIIWQCVLWLRMYWDILSYCSVYAYLFVCHYSFISLPLSLSLSLSLSLACVLIINFCGCFLLLLFFLFFFGGGRV